MWWWICSRVARAELSLSGQRWIKKRWMVFKKTNTVKVFVCGGTRAGGIVIVSLDWSADIISVTQFNTKVKHTNHNKSCRAGNGGRCDCALHTKPATTIRYVYIAFLFIFSDYQHAKTNSEKLTMEANSVSLFHCLHSRTVLCTGLCLA